MVHSRATENLSQDSKFQPPRRSSNEARVIELVLANPGLFSVDSAAIQLLLAPNTVRSVVRRGLVSLREHRLYPVE